MDLELKESHGCDKPWVAKILGADDEHFGLQRQFLPLRVLSMARSGKPKYWGYSLRAPGLYEVGAAGTETGFWLVDGSGHGTTTGSVRAREIAKLLDAGMEFEAARRQTVD